MLLLSVNIDHIATLRQARRETFPDPVQAAAAVEQGGADGVTVHLRSDRRHINDRDVRLLRKTVQTELTVEMAATREMVRIARSIRPDWVTLVPEEAGEVTTTRGLDVVRNRRELGRAVASLRKAGIRVCLFVDPKPEPVAAAAEIGVEAVELNTDRYSRLWRKKESGQRALGDLSEAAAAAAGSGLVVNVGHGLNYLNVVPILEARFARGFSIGFAIVARAVFAGLRDAVAEMKRLLEVYS
uniref:Pyridoxine 5'-phosphate synthase n=1 Tax=candidate division WOR-3 bacterium TaxID=2052148 RepID=A0A7C4CAI5_UNCW3